MNSLLIFIGKLLSGLSKTFNRGSGSTWPGEIALSAKQNFIKDLLTKNSQLHIIFVVGTNGKTTTSTMIMTILQQEGEKVFRNTSGANLKNGIASSLLLHSTLLCKIHYDYAIFEVDENTLPLLLEDITPSAIVILNLFRDQLDRYGELDSIAKRWNVALKPTSLLVLNADDPLVAYLGESREKTIYFGLDAKEMKQKSLAHGADSIYCPRCQHKLTYSHIAYSHLGDWECKHCGLERPKISIKNQELSIKYSLEGLYNEYNALAAISVTKALGAQIDAIKKGLEEVTPAFGRQEKISYNGKEIQIFLSKNPTSFNQSLDTIVSLGGKHVLFVLNDRIPDGRDVSWIWDINLESYVSKFKTVVVSGDRTYDMGLRVDYSRNFKFQISNFKSNSKSQIQNTQYIIEPDLPEAIGKSLENIKQEETLYILPTYSAMLDVRKILTGRKIKL